MKEDSSWKEQAGEFTATPLCGPLFNAEPQNAVYQTPDVGCAHPQLWSFPLGKKPMQMMVLPDNATGKELMENADEVNETCPHLKYSGR